MVLSRLDSMVEQEIKHYGIPGMKWGVRKFIERQEKGKTHRDRLQNKYLEKGYSKEEASKRAANRIRAEKALAIAGGVTLAAAFTGRATYQAVKKHNRIKRQEKQEKAKRTRIYDRSSGNYWHLKKELTNKQWLEVNKRKKAGEKTGDILTSMKVLKK